MIIHGYIGKSKKRKVPKQQQADYDAWLKSIEAMKPKSLSKFTQHPPVKSPVASGVYVRETQKIKSLNSGMGEIGRAHV